MATSHKVQRKKLCNCKSNMSSTNSNTYFRKELIVMLIRKICISITRKTHQTILLHIKAQSQKKHLDNFMGCLLYCFLTRQTCLPLSCVLDDYCIAFACEWPTLHIACLCCRQNTRLILIKGKTISKMTNPL